MEFVIIIGSNESLNISDILLYKYGLFLNLANMFMCNWKLMSVLCTSLILHSSQGKYG